MGQDIFNKKLIIENSNGDELLSFTVSPDGLLFDFHNCEIADLDNDYIRIQKIK